MAFWHSSAHILGHSMELIYGGWLTIGPPVDDGFYYDMYSEDYRVSDNDFKVLDDLVKNIVKEKQPFERLEMKKSDLLEMFKYNKFKVTLDHSRDEDPLCLAGGSGSKKKKFKLLIRIPAFLIMQIRIRVQVLFSKADLDSDPGSAFKIVRIQAYPDSNFFIEKYVEIPS